MLVFSELVAFASKRSSHSRSRWDLPWNGVSAQTGLLHAHRRGGPPCLGPTGRPAAAQKLLLVLTDGRPNDIDHYEGRFAVEDTRKAVREARRLGIAVFGVTVDASAQSYFPALFGRGGYAIVGNIRRLPAALPAIYRQLAR